MSFSLADYHMMQSRLHHSLSKSRKDSPVPADAVEREADLHEMISAECNRRGWVAIHSRMDRATTYSVGIADFIIFADAGRMFVVECKSRLGKLSIAQESFIKQLAGLSHRVKVVKSFSAFMEFVDKPTD